MKNSYVILGFVAVLAVGIGYMTLGGGPRIGISSVRSSFGYGLDFQIQNLGNLEIDGVTVRGEIIYGDPPNYIFGNMTFTFERYLGKLYAKEVMQVSIGALEMVRTSENFYVSRVPPLEVRFEILTARTSKPIMFYFIFPS